jgi:hypothetical protein
VWQAGTGAPTSQLGRIEASLLDVGGPGQEETRAITLAGTTQALVVDPANYELVGP